MAAAAEEGASAQLGEVRLPEVPRGEAVDDRVQAAAKSEACCYQPDITLVVTRLRDPALRLLLMAKCTVKLMIKKYREASTV